MLPTDDSVLLRQYAENHSDEAFAALVTRHINLVYSVALRCVGDPHQAEEVAQAVFILLAKKAAQLRHDKALSSWLFQTTRLTASNFIRGETRRHRREQEAHMQSVLNDPGNDVWPRIAPLLDDAVAGLNEKDRDAIVLRFYEGRSLREVGAVLGASEDAAEKRVSRAVERLREFFAKRGVTVGASGLVVVVSANAVQVAPAGLTVTISTAAALAGTAVHNSIAIAMTTLQKILVTTAITGTLITAFYETRQAAFWRNQSQELREQTGTQIHQLTDERDEVMRRLAVMAVETNRAGNTVELLRLRGEMARLKALESAVAKLREESLRHQSQARKAMEDLAAAQQGTLQFAIQRVTSIDALKQVGRQLRELAAANNLAAAFTADGKLNPTLIAGTHPNFEMKNVELTLSDPSQLPKLLQEAPETVVARTVDPVATPDERWMRFYIQANGSVQNYSTPFSNQVFSSNWQLEYLKP